MQVKRISPVIALAIILALAGCGSKGGQKLTQVAPDPQPYSINPSSDNPFDIILATGLDALKRAGEFETRTTYPEKVKVEMVQKLAPCLQRLSTIGSRPSIVPAAALNPYEPRDELRGLALLAKGVAFAMEDYCTKAAWDKAISLYLTANQVAVDLAGSDVATASAGFAMAEAARKELTPYLHNLGAGQLQTIGKKSLDQLDKKPLAEVTILNESRNMLQGIQYIQEAYAKEDFEILHQQMYKQAEPAIEYLEQLKEDEAPAYFDGFVKEQKVWVDHAVAQSKLPTKDRISLEWEKNLDRPWKRFSSHIFSTLDAFLVMDDIYLARTRLFAITSLAIAQGKSTGKVQPNLSFIPQPHRIDPCSGREFPFRATGRSFKVYSVGTDGRDDGGDTNESRLAPDLRLETM